jgi:RHH-type rel operon transcriptional repressor/antitoxin RelB
MPPVQMNVRIDEQQKTAGDAVFALVGYTPTEVVRAVWGFAARNAGEPSAVKDLLHSMRAPVGDEQLEEQRRRRLLLDEGANIYQRFLDEVGIDQLPPADEPDLRAMRRQAYGERAAGKGETDA